LYLWSVQKCKLLIQQVDRSIDFNSFNHSNKLIRNIDILTDRIGPLSPRALIRIIYIEVMNAVRPEPMQTFYLSKYQKKYTNFLFLRKFGFDPQIAYQIRTIPFDYSQLKCLKITPKKFIIDNIEKNINITKQNK
jgi:hypothetical protein